MKNLIKFILQNEETAGNWNGKFYSSNGVTTIYLDSVQYNVTAFYEECRKPDGYVYSSEIYDEYKKISDPLIELSLDLDMGDITIEQFQLEKTKIIQLYEKI